MLFRSNPGLSIDFYVKDICGPVFLTRTVLKFRQDIKLLSKELFNPEPKDFNQNIFTKHMISGLWGKDAINIVENTGENYYDFIRRKYLEVRKLDVNNLDFYRPLNEIN